MSIFVNKNTKIIVQGITGTQGMLHTDLMLKYGSNIVAGTNPKKAGTEVYGVPVYGSVKQAKQETDANASIIFVPPAFAGEAIKEAIDAEIEFVVCITENILFFFFIFNFIINFFIYNYFFYLFYHLVYLDYFFLFRLILVLCF